MSEQKKATVSDSRKRVWIQVSSHFKSLFIILVHDITTVFWTSIGVAGIFAAGVY